MRTPTEDFLERLPVGLEPDEALAAIAAISRHVARVLGVGGPTSFADVVAPAPMAIRDALELLADQDCTPDLLGSAWEQLLASAARREQGAHFTPPAVAERIVSLAADAANEVFVGEFPRIWDPSAGGGAFLLAGARFLASTAAGLADRGEIAQSCFASDVDAVALRVCDAALEIWSGGEGRPVTAHADALLDLPEDWPKDFGLIVGNPPFLGQLTSDTARSAEDLVRLRQQFGDVVGGYVDQAALFIELGLRRIDAGGAVALLLPQSVLGAADTEQVRISASSQSHLVHLWIDDVGVFAASVEVVAAVFAEVPRETSPTTAVQLGDNEVITVRTPSPQSWAPLLAAAQGIPSVALPSAGQRLGDIAGVTAGFRQHFYGISDAVVEQVSYEGELSVEDGVAALMTSGTIDPLANGWGRLPVKFAGRKWAAPVLRLGLIEDAAVRDWFAQRMVPKLLLASQTPVLEAVVDPVGVFVPSVPVISIEPVDETMLWHLVAAISAPTTCAAMLTEAAGTGLSSAAIRVRAKSLSDIILPAPSQDWDRGAAAAKLAHQSWMSGDDFAYRSGLENLAEAMTAAYGAEAGLARWWTRRLTKRKSAARAY